MDRDLLLRMYHDKNYFKYTLKERKEMSIRYGMQVWKVKLQVLIVYIKMEILILRNKIKNR